MSDLITCSCASCTVHRLADANTEFVRSLIVSVQCSRCGKATAKTVHLVLAKHGAVLCDRKGCRHG